MFSTKPLKPAQIGDNSTVLLNSSAACPTSNSPEETPRFVLETSVMTTLKTTITAALFGLTMSATSATANPANVERVTEGLIATGMAYELGEKCDGVSARLLRGLNFLYGLKSHLQDLGYSNAEIDAFVDDRAEKDRLEAIACARLASLGVRTDDPATYCAVARSQIAQDTQVGRLLR
jgi:hypothetical protein